MKVLLTGSKGQLGSCFRDRLPSGWDLLATDSESLDISDLARVKQVVADYRPDVIVNAAAYTAVDKAESDGELAARINEQGPSYLALAAAARLSADPRLNRLCFDGRASRPYREDDATNPLGFTAAPSSMGSVRWPGCFRER